VAVAAPEQQRILVAGSRIQVQEQRISVEAGPPIAPAADSTISAATIFTAGDKPLIRNTV